MNLFMGERAECHHCHGTFIFSDQATYAGAPERAAAASTTPASTTSAAPARSRSPTAASSSSPAARGHGRVQGAVAAQRRAHRALHARRLDPDARGGGRPLRRRRARHHRGPARRRRPGEPVQGPADLRHRADAQRPRGPRRVPEDPDRPASPRTRGSRIRWDEPAPARPPRRARARARLREGAYHAVVPIDESGERREWALGASVRGAAGSLAITGAPLTPPGDGPPVWAWIALVALGFASLVLAVLRGVVSARARPGSPVPRDAAPARRGWRPSRGG